MVDKPTIVHIQRKKRAGSNFSLEFIFSDVRARLRTRYDFKVVIMERTSNGILNRVFNIFQALFSQGKVNHVTGDIHYVTYLLRKRSTILTILDCGFLNEPNRIKRKILKWLWLDLPVYKSSYITTISEASKRDIVANTHCEPQKVRVIPVAVDDIYIPCPKKFNTENPVLLQIGTAPNKNIERLVKAITGLKCKLVFVGIIPEHIREMLMSRNIDFENRVNLSQEEMYRAYCDCDIVTFVSTFEGFGMPIIEANCVERPVITGSTTSMPEVAGDAACLVDAFSIESIRQGLERIITDEKYRSTLVENGRINRERFSNERIAGMYGEVYNIVLSTGKKA